MCGIYCSIGVASDIRANKQTLEYLRARGPDSAQQLSLSVNSPLAGSETLEICVFATVLALRGNDVEPQPLQTGDCQSFLCWNGEAWEHQGQVFSGSDSRHVFNLLCQASRGTATSTVNNVLDTLTKIAGPFAFVFYHARSKYLFYGRDPIGRRSLLSKPYPDGGIALCSIADEVDFQQWKEVDVGGVSVVNLSDRPLKQQFIPWPVSRPHVNPILPKDQIHGLTASSTAVIRLEQSLRVSMDLRVADIPSLGLSAECRTPGDAKIAILFSGGLDCTVLSRLAHDQLPIDESIDLLNVAFENPRSISAASKVDKTVSTYEDCPDRKTGRASFLELLSVCKGRNFRFIAIDVPYAESQTERQSIVRLMAPHSTEMDLSISMALFFAARGRGQSTCSSDQHCQPYQTPARVLLSGLGADELFAGYTRHATASARGGLQALIQELDLDIQRLGQRNLGRDDRVISHWGREVRYPYLDEDFMAWSLRLPVWEKCGHGDVPRHRQVKVLDQEETAVNNRGAEISLDPSKKLLRLLAWRLGMRRVANEKKRAIQFGARTAKMHISRGGGRVKGTDLVR